MIILYQESMNLAERFYECPPTRGGEVAGIQDPEIMSVDASYPTVGIQVCTVVGDCGIRLREAEAVAASVPWATVSSMGCIGGPTCSIRSR